jgi:rhodanese-related sulfurtransferase
MDKQLQYYQNKLDFEMDPSDLFEALERGENYIPLDARRAAAFKKEHIPGAINIPHREMNENSVSQLDKTKIYACYCSGIGCNASTRGALKMTRLGFKVKELTGGLEWWIKDGYATEGEKASKGQMVQCAC